jgi:hypothetical protein
MPSADEVLEADSPMGRILRVPGFSPARAQEAVRLHQAVLMGEECGALYKRAVKSKVTGVDLPREGGGVERLCVKEFIRPPALRWFPARWRHRPALRSWNAAIEIERRGISAPRRLALVLGPARSSFLVMSFIEEALPLDEFVESLFVPGTPLPRRREFLHAGAEFLNNCARASVHHKDMKASNVFVRSRPGGGWEFILIDLAAVRVPWAPRPEERVLNLAQLHSSIGLALSFSDRLRFMKDLAREEPTLAGRDTLCEIGRLALRRRCAWER